MGAQWKQAGREINAHKKGQMVVKLVREIMVAAKMGGADADLNARLFVDVEKAKKSSVTKDTIERAIKKARDSRMKKWFMKRSSMKVSRRTKFPSSWNV